MTGMQWTRQIKKKLSSRSVILVAVGLVFLGYFVFLYCGDTWRVYRVVDGDTLWARKGTKTEKVRLKGIDAPEIAHPDYGKPRGEFYGKEASKCLSDMVAGDTVRFEFAKKETERDKYGRLLAYVFDGDTLVNAELVRQGCARAYRRYRHPRKEEFIRLERIARKRKLGMWGRTP